MRKAWAWGVAAIVCALGVMHGGCGTDSSGIGPTPGDDAGPGDDDATTGHTCGNGVVEAPEQCDLGAGKNVNGTGCDSDCSFSCTASGNDPGLTKCAMNACADGVTCNADHQCVAGSMKPPGTTCGAGKICNGGNCTAAVCGDGFITAPEECDDSNSMNGDGCDTDCKFSCVSNDPTRNCTPADACQGAGTCNDSTHKCTPGQPEPDGTMCPTGVCKGGHCIPASCGDGSVESGEDCDFGNGNGAGTGCETDCKFSCAKTPSDTCVTADLCMGTNTCTTNNGPNNTPGQKCVQGSPPPDGTDCGNGGKCMGGICKTATCGDGTLQNGEQCDFGMNNNVAGSGCEPDCQFSCQKNPDSCPNADPCASNHEACGNVTGPNNTMGQKCAASSPLAMCAACGSGAVCVSNQCKSSQCGDGCVDANKGETCEPPNTATCDSQCHAIKCGDGVRSGTEQCDDHNTTNLDGCDSNCNFEQDHRANQVTMNFKTQNLCPSNANALGGAIANAAQSNVQTSLTNGVNDGSTTIMLKFMNIKDLTGTNDTAKLGGLSGTPVAAPNGVTYNGASDMEWWYTTDPASIDPSRDPKTFLMGNIVAKLLNATGTIDLGINLSGGPVILHMSGAHIRANVGGVSKPGISSNAMTPGHLTTENLDPALTSFDSMSNGELCGNISALSLSQVPVPMALLSGIGACSQNYDMTSHLLDVLVKGCNGFLGIQEITPTQPDQVDPAAPPAGAGGKYTLTTSGTPPKVTGCKDKNNATVDLMTCLTSAAYSSDFTFTTDRVISK